MTSIMSDSLAQGDMKVIDEASLKKVDDVNKFSKSVTKKKKI